MQAPTGEQHRIALSRLHERSQPQGPVLRRTQGIEFVGVEHDVLVAAVFVALDDGGAVDRAMHRAVLGVADALTAVGVQLMEVAGLAVRTAGKAFTGTFTRLNCRSPDQLGRLSETLAVPRNGSGTGPCRMLNGSGRRGANRFARRALHREGPSARPGFRTAGRSSSTWKSLQVLPSWRLGIGTICTLADPPLVGLVLLRWRPRGNAGRGFRSKRGKSAR